VTAALALATAAAPTAGAAQLRSIADSPADAGYVALHTRHSTSYVVKAHGQVTVTLKGLPVQDVVAATVSLTVSGTGSGSVTLWPAGTPRPAATLSFTTRATASTVVTPGPQRLLNGSAHPVKVVVTAQGYYPSAATALAGGAPGYFVPIAARRVLHVSLKPHTTTTYKTLKAAPIDAADAVLTLAATATKAGQLKAFAFHSVRKAHVALPLTARATSRGLVLVQPSGYHNVGLSNASGGTTTVTANAVGYVMPFDVPSQVEYVNATASPGGALVTWQPPLHIGGMPITSYVVSVFPNGVTKPAVGPTYTVPGTAGSASIPLAVGHGYWFGVVAVTAVGQGGTMTTNIPVIPQPLPVPSHVTATTAGVGHATVSWTLSPPSGTPVTSYTVTPSHGAAVTLPAPAATTTLALPSGLTATFTVTANYALGSSMPSAPSNRVTILGVPGPGVTTRVSSAVDPTQPAATQLAGDTPAVSRGGRYVAFSSTAPLVAGDTNGVRDIFVRDLVTGVTTRVSVASDGSQADGDSDAPVISDDGRYVAFESFAADLAPESWNNGHLHVFRHDLQTGVTALVSVDVDGAQADAGEPSISGDGNRVAFVSDSSRLATDNNGAVDVFVRDMAAGSTVIASMGNGGVASDGLSEAPSISEDGNSVAFASYADTLVTGVTNAWEEIFVRNLQAGTTTWVSQAVGGTRQDADSYWPAVSADGRYVAFESAADNLVPGDTNGLIDVFVRDTHSGTTTRVSVASNGAQAGGDDLFDQLGISADGQRVAFTFPEGGLVAGGTDQRTGVFIHDMATGATTEASVASDGSATAKGADLAAISPDGGFLAFVGTFTGLDQVDGLAVAGVFEHAIG
jgi:Tol biopolymer transport system component